MFMFTANQQKNKAHSKRKGSRIVDANSRTPHAQRQSTVYGGVGRGGARWGGVGRGVAGWDALLSPVTAECR